MTQYLAMAGRSPGQRGISGVRCRFLGRDGTLWNIQPQSLAAGRVFAKTGTFSLQDPLNRRTIITGKGLAGYMTTSSGRHVSFAVYANQTRFLPTTGDDAALLVGQAPVRFASAVWSIAVSGGALRLRRVGRRALPCDLFVARVATRGRGRRIFSHVQRARGLIAGRSASAGPDRREGERHAPKWVSRANDGTTCGEL